MPGGNVTGGSALGEPAGRSIDLATRSAAPKRRANASAGESVFVRAHQDMRVCGPVDPKTNTRDTRRFLNASWLLGPALANTGLHELGHFIANLEHTTDPTNIMSDGGSKPKLAERSIKTQREFWATPQIFNDDQKKRLVAQLKTGVWLGGMTVTPGP